MHAHRTEFLTRLLWGDEDLGYQPIFTRVQLLTSSLTFSEPTTCFSTITSRTAVSCVCATVKATLPTDAIHASQLALKLDSPLAFLHHIPPSSCRCPTMLFPYICIVYLNSLGSLAASASSVSLVVNFMWSTSIQERIY